jgi:phenylpropionate dioxygenase-like ring-hydroxylating dioxygenase large terminal subunit
VARALLRTGQNMGRFPFGTPTGWFPIAFADDVARGAVLPVQAFGRELVLWRDEAGLAHVLDAYCPHLGAHLGRGGRLEDGALRCPFHGWRIGVEGACLSVPCGGKVPPHARIRVWPVDEVGGLLLVFHGPEGAAPAWRVPPVPDHTADAYHPFVRRSWTLRSHPQDIVENVVDAAHFTEVHALRAAPMTDVEADGPFFRGTLTWKLQTPRGDVDGSFRVTVVGLGVIVMRHTGMVDAIIVSAATPIDEERMQVSLSVSIRRTGDASPDRGLGAAMIADVHRQFEQDMVILENKIYREQAALTATDAAVLKLRRWARQFYTAVSVAKS